jgi:nitric oxide reductase large subunit
MLTAARCQYRVPRDSSAQFVSVFLKYGLTDNGSIWGHGGYLGPDFAHTHRAVACLQSAS